VERSDTHQLQLAKMMGIAKGSTHPCTNYEEISTRPDGTPWKRRYSIVIARP
jgi:hypothetical protein